MNKTFLCLTSIIFCIIAACGGDDGAAGSGGASATSSGSAGGPSTGVGAGSGSGGFEACATATVEGERIPVQMYIMFDKSGSMLEDQKWAGAKAALIAFFQDDDSAGLNIALRFFPDDEPVAGCSESGCDAAACAAPLVDVGELNSQPAHSDPHQAALVAAVESKMPAGQTPLYSALAGATQWAVSHSSAEQRTAVVLVTDGEPNDMCNQPTSSIAPLASAALTMADVRTYTIGMSGADITLLDAIAAAGDTGEAFVIGQGSVHNDLVAAFEKIGTSPVSCNLPLPEAMDIGDEVNPGEVNLSYTPGDGDAETIPQVGGAAECGTDGGWYYDNAGDPTQLILCDTTCAAVQDDPGAVLSVVLGCKTVLK